MIVSSIKFCIVLRIRFVSVGLRETDTLRKEFLFGATFLVDFADVCVIYIYTSRGITMTSRCSLESTIYIISDRHIRLVLLNPGTINNCEWLDKYNGSLRI